MRAIIQTLDLKETNEQDHPDVSLINDEKGWSISLYPGGVATFENLNDDDPAPRFLHHIDRERAFSLWCQLAEGRIEALQELKWKRAE